MTEAPNADPWPVLKTLPMGQRVELTTRDGKTWAGTLLPSHELSGARTIQLKLENGYNVGILVDGSDTLKVVGDPPKDPNGNGVGPPAAPGTRSSTPWVALLTTGGTIASRVDYRTGGVRPVKEESEILAFYPDLARDGPVRVVHVFDRLSEDIAPEDWLHLAREVVRVFSEGARGVVVAHGTDTLAYTAAGLSFLLPNLPGPVVLVGAQRSPDRPSSDGFSNLATAVRIAREAHLGEVVVLMHAGLSDDRFAIHRGTRVRKMHSSRRDAFQSRNLPPLGIVDGATIVWHESPRPASGPLLEEKLHLGHGAGLLWFYPGLDPERASAFASTCRGVVLAGTGLGHVSAAHLPWIRAAVERGTIVVMTTQCLEGSVDPYVYATGRELLRAGVVYVGDMLPETAYAKLLWALGRTEDPSELRGLMLADRAGEFSPRRTSAGDR